MNVPSVRNVASVRCVAGVRCAAGEITLRALPAKTALCALLAKQRYVRCLSQRRSWRPFAPPLRDEAVAVNHSAVAVHHSGPPGLGPKGVVNRSIG